MGVENGKELIGIAEMNLDASIGWDVPEVRAASDYGAV
jgi:hypothetical protein